MAYQTRKGTVVRQQTASVLAIIYEAYRDAAEYFVYQDVRVGDPETPRFDAVEGDHILVYSAENPDLAHALNLTTGGFGIVAWNDLAHSVKPYDPEERA